MNILLLLLPCAILAIIIYVYATRDPSLARMARWQLAFILSAAAGMAATFLAATTRMPLRDNVATAIDKALGFDWMTTTEFVNSHGLLWWPLAIAYFSLTPQLFASVFYFSLREWDWRNRELLFGALIGLSITIFLFMLFPMLGPLGSQSEWAQIILNLRAHGIGGAGFCSLGYISFPSFHTIMALLLTWAHRGTRLFVPIAILNATMVLGVCPLGNHYLTDLLAGAVLAGAIMLTASFWPRRLFDRLDEPARRISPAVWIAPKLDQGPGRDGPRHDLPRVGEA